MHFSQVCFDREFQKFFASRCPPLPAYSKKLLVKFSHTWVICFAAAVCGKGSKNRKGILHHTLPDNFACVGKVKCKIEFAMLTPHGFTE
jgi:hypothetical protein